MSEDILAVQEKRKPGRPPVLKVQSEEYSETPEVQKTDENVVLSKSQYEELQKLVMFAEANMNKDKAPEDNISILINRFTEALRDVRKPYKSEAELTSEKTQRDQSKRQERIKRFNIESSQSNCNHLAGNYPGSRPSDLTTIVWHEVHSHFIVGLCQACNRQFWPNDPDYRTWRIKPSYCKPSQSGDRMTSAEEVQEWAKREHPIPFGQILSNNGIYINA